MPEAITELPEWLSAFPAFAVPASALRKSLNHL